MENERALTGITWAEVSAWMRPRAGAAIALATLIIGSACGSDSPTTGVLVIETDSSASLTESGGSSRLTVALGRRPLSDVVVPVVSGDPTEGRATPAQLTFTPDSWATPQEVVVAGVNDDIVDGPVAFRVLLGPTTSGDLEFAGVTGESGELTTADDDGAGIVVMASDTSTSESGESGAIRVALAARPSADVVIALRVSDPGEGELAPASVTFSPHNWNAVQTVTVTGVDDDQADGDQTFTVELAVTSDDPTYAGVVAPDPISFVNTDDDSAAVRVSEVSGTISEDGGAATFTVVLQTPPSSDVTIGVQSSDLEEASVAPETLTFTAESWNVAQAVTITGVDDTLADGDQEIAIQLGAPETSDASYAALEGSSITVTNVDNDSPGIVVGEPSRSTGEDGRSATVVVVLAAPPTADVVIGATVSDATEATSSPAELVFTTANWREPQTITLTGVDDIVSDGDQAYELELSAPESTDAGYAALAAPAGVPMINIDDDTEAQLLRTTYTEGPNTFYVAHSWFHSIITPLDEPMLPAADAHWRVVPGLADPRDPTLVSFVPEGYPDHYFRVDSQSPNGYPPCDEPSLRGGALCWVAEADRHHLAWVHPYQDTERFRRDATFRIVPARDGDPSKFSLQWYGEPDSTRFVRHRAYQVFATPLSSATDDDEATFSLEPIPN